MHVKHRKFEVFKVVLLKIQVFWDVRLGSAVRETVHDVSDDLVRLSLESSTGVAWDCLLHDTKKRLKLFARRQ
jgi:hypothetical protein